MYSRATGPSSGTVNLGGRIVTYRNLTPIEDTVLAQDRVFAMDVSGGQEIRLTDDGDPNNNLTLIDSNGTGGFEQTTFASPTGSLTVNAGDGDDIITLLSVDPSFAAPTTLNGEDGNDTFDVHPSASSTVTVDGGDDIVGDVLNFDAEGLAVTFEAGRISANGRQPVLFSGIEHISIFNAQSITVQGGSTGDLLCVEATQADGGTFKLNDGPDVSFVGIESFAFDAGLGDDDLKIANSATALFAPTQGISYDGGDGDNDILMVSGDLGFTINQASINIRPGGEGSMTNDPDGIVAFPTSPGGDAEVITFLGTEVVNDIQPVIRLDVREESNAADLIEVQDGEVVDGLRTMTVRSLGLDVHFGQKTILGVSADGGADRIIVNSPQVATGLTRIDLFGNITPAADPALGETDDHAGDIFEIESIDVAVNVYGQDGDDTINVGSTDIANNGNLDTIQGLLTLIGGAGNDRIIVNDHGKAGRANYTISPTSLVNFDLPPTMIPPSPLAGVFWIPRTFAGINYDGTSESLQLDATDGVNVFDVKPSNDTEYTINGNLPPPGDCTFGGGDYLRLDTTGTAGRKLHITGVGSGFWSFDSPTKNVNFESIERFNHVDEIASVSNSSIIVRDAETLDQLFVLKSPGRLWTHLHVAVADVNCDGLPDIVVTCGTSNLFLQVYSGAPNAQGIDTALEILNKAPGIGSGADYSLAIGDVNGDGCNDIVLSREDRGSFSVTTLDGSTLFTTPKVLSKFGPYKTALAPIRLDVSDIDNDGIAEILVSFVQLNPKANAVDIFNVHGTLLKSLTLPGTPIGAFARVGDYNGDGTRDLIVENYVNNGIYVTAFDGHGILKNTPPVTLAGPINIPSPKSRFGPGMVLKPLDGGDPGFVDTVGAWAIGTANGSKNTPAAALWQVTWVNNVKLKIVEKPGFQMTEVD